MNQTEFLKDLFGLDGQVAVVIGGAGVLGYALAQGIGLAGAKLVLASGNGSACQEAALQLEQQGIEAIGTSVDVSDKDSLLALREKVLSWAGRVDLLVNCAGINAGSSFLNLDVDQWDKIMAVNLKGTMLSCQVFIESMLQTGGGSILNIGSVTSDRPLSRVFAYAASKAGVVNLTQNIAQEFATQGIRANAICPGFFPAKQNQKLLDEKRVANIMNATPMKRYGEPSELVGPALTMLSKKAGSYLTGSVLYVDGGVTSSWF